MQSMKKSYKIGIIFLISFVIRFLYLGSVPVSLSHDETDNIIQAHSVLRTHSDIEGVWQPWSLLPNSGVMAELGPLINLPALSILPQSIFAARFTTALLSSIFPCIIFYWLSLIGVTPWVGLTAAFLLATSPWHIIFSRTALEQPTSLFFYMVSWVFLVKLFKKSAKLSHYILYAVSFALTYTIGFFTYHGFKFALPGMTIIHIGWLVWQSKPKQIKPGLLAFSVVLLLIIRTVLYSSHYQSRSSEIILFQNDRFAQIVNSERRQSVAPSTLKSIFVNKPVVLLDTLRDKYVGAISPDLLFLHGESNGVFSVWQAGYLYLFTLPFLLYGFFYLITQHKREHLLIVVLLLVSPMASVIHINNTFAFRSAIYFVLLNIVLAYGVVSVFDLIKKYYPKLARYSIFLFFILLLSGLASFCYIEFFVTPITNANDYFFGDRLVANYVRLDHAHKILLIEPQPRYSYSAIVLSEGSPTLDTILSFNHRYSPTDLDEYHTDNVSIIRGCPTGDVAGYDTVIINKNILATVNNLCPTLISNLATSSKQRTRSLVSPKDSGEEQVIIGDSLCDGMELSQYVSPTSLRDFDLEKMNQGEFCNRWVVVQ